MSLSCSGLDRLVTCPSLRLVRDGKELKKATIIRSFHHPDGDVVVRVKEIEGVDEAETLRGCHLAIPAGDRAELPEGSFYINDLVGLKVQTEEGLELGTVEDVLEGANGVCVVRKGGAETLIPMLRSVIQKVDLTSKTMVVSLPEEIDADNTD